jgi:type III restriction enzyme
MRHTEIVFGKGRNLASSEWPYNPRSVINEVREHVDARRELAPSQRQVTSETARLVLHWRHQTFGGSRPLFYQTAAIGAWIWRMEVAPHQSAGKRPLESA